MMVSMIFQLSLVHWSRFTLVSFTVGGFDLGHQHCITFLPRFEITDSLFAVTSPSIYHVHVRVEVRN